MRIGSLLITIFSVFAVLLFSCDGKKISGNKSVDSLFLGISMGMERKAFFDYCWEMNNKKIFTHGPTNQSVQYMLEKELSSPVVMQFYPSFKDEKIYEMPVLFSYNSWAPWNREYFSNVLFPEILTLFRKWYGDDFQELEHKTMGKIYYQMKGTRRINIFIKDDQFVQAVFTDLKIEKQIREESERQAQE